MSSECFWPCIKAVIRTFFYQLFLLFVLCSVVFITMPEQVGFRSMTLYMSYINHFHPISFERALPLLKRMGEFRTWAGLGYPEDFKVIDDAMAAEEWYWCKYQYTNSKGIVVTEISSIRLRWKPWEYYYDLKPAETEESMRDYLENGSLNSRETDRAFRLRREYLELQRNKRRV
jgi:hypothetical protein